MSLRFISFLFCLYAIQGIPYGIQSRFLPVYLRSKSFSLTVLGLLKLLYIPWILKTFYAPIFDLKWNRLGWLKLSILMLFFVSILTAFITENSTSELIICLFLLNFFSASQDIALDGIMLSKLSSEEISWGNIAQVVGYKSGAIFGGGILLFLSQYLSWNWLFYLVGMFYSMGFCSLFIFDSYFRLRDQKPSDITLNDHWTEFKLTLYEKSTITVIFLVLIYKLGEQGAMTLLPLFLYDSGFDIKEIGLWTGIVGQVISVLGSSIAAVFIKRRGIFNTLMFLSNISVCIHLLMILTVRFYPKNFYLSCLLMNTMLLISGIKTTTVFSLMMLCSQSKLSCVQSSHYTLLATIEVCGKLLFSSIIGWLADVTNYTTCYVGFLLLAGVFHAFLVVCGRNNINGIENSITERKCQ